MNMLEKAARAVAAADERNGGPPYEYRIQNKHAKEMLFDEVRAVLAAIREPETAIVMAGAEATVEGSVLDAELAFTAMIDAILEGESK